MTEKTFIIFGPIEGSENQKLGCVKDKGNKIKM